MRCREAGDLLPRYYKTYLDQSRSKSPSGTDKWKHKKRNASRSCEFIAVWPRRCSSSCNWLKSAVWDGSFVPRLFPRQEQNIKPTLRLTSSCFLWERMWNMYRPGGQRCTYPAAVEARSIQEIAGSSSDVDLWPPVWCFIQQDECTAFKIRCSTNGPCSSAGGGSFTPSVVEIQMFNEMNFSEVFPHGRT